MAQLLQHVECVCCGHRHHFCLPTGTLDTQYPYEYVCPETGQKTYLRPTSGGESVAYYPQGAVELVATADTDPEDGARRSEPGAGIRKPQ